MKRVAVAAMAVGAVLSSFATTPAFAHHLSPAGFLCGYEPDLVTEPGMRTGQVDGVLVLDDGMTPPGGYSGYLTCTVQVNAPTHAGADAAVVAGLTTAGVIAAHGRVTFAAGPSDDVYLCTQIDVDGETLYFDDSDDPLVDGTWSTSPGADCGSVTRQDFEEVPIPDRSWN